MTSERSSGSGLEEMDWDSIMSRMSRDSRIGGGVKAVGALVGSAEMSGEAIGGNGGIGGAEAMTPPSSCRPANRALQIRWIPNRERDADMETMATVAAFSPSKLLSSSCSLFSHALSHRSFPCLSASVQQRIRSRSTFRISAVSPRRRTLSEEWDLSNSVAAPGAFQMPSFEELDTTNMLLRQRIVFLGSQVDTVTADLVINQILFLDAEYQQKEIKLFINSPGGSVTAGMGIYDAMKLCKADVSTVCLGLAASMGAFLLASGTKGKRFCMPNAKVMIHQPMGSAGGKATEMAMQIREMMYHKIKMVKILSRITGKPEHQLEVDTARDFFLNPWEAKEYGLVDAIIDDGKPGLVAPIGDSAPPPKTLIWDLWTAEDMKKSKQNLPSEEKLLQNGNKIGGGNDKEGKEQPKEEPTTV